MNVGSTPPVSLEPPVGEMEERRCPKCGKLMEEEPKFKGLWLCPDKKIRLNDAPPYRFKCEGMELTEEGAAELDEALTRAWLKRAREMN